VKKLSIVMPCHNRREALYLTLTSLCQQTVPGADFEVLVIDQASTDGSRELVRSFLAPFELRLVEQDAKYGISIARNAGAQEAQSEFVLLLDADLIADRRLVEAHLALHQSRQEALLCGRVLPYPPAYSSYVEMIADPEAGLDRGEQADFLPFYQGFGGHMAFSKEVYRHIGPFDPALKGFEDIDFAYRADRLGYLICNNTLAISYHNHPRTLKERYEQARAYNRMLPVLFERYPELKGQIPLLQDYEPIHWGKDRGKRLINKLRVRVFGLSPVQRTAQAVLIFLNQKCRFPRMVRFLYWQLLIGNWYLGFRDGSAALRRASDS
jgi:glycosyltransferase involved in cell wall biosynthesis